MKPFDLERAKAGDPVVTAVGGQVEILCFDRGGSVYPLVALLGQDRSVVETYTTAGEIYEGHQNDTRNLRMAAVKREGYINLCRDDLATYLSCIIHPDEKTAKDNAGAHVVATLRIEWEE